MATFTGHDGVIKFADTDDSLSLAANGIANLRNFTIEQTQDTIEDTTMGTTGMRSYKPGLSTFTLSGDLFFDGGDATQAKIDELVSKVGGESNATFEVFPSGTAGGNTKLAGSCIITSFSITSSVDGMVEASFAAQGTGALTLTQL